MDLKTWMLLLLVAAGTLAASTGDGDQNQGDGNSEPDVHPEVHPEEHPEVHPEEEGSGDAEEHHPEPKHKDEHYHWTHEAVDEWPAHFEHCNLNGKRQSPINIIPNGAVYWDKLTPIDLLETAVDETHDIMTVANNGHSVGISLNKDVMVTGGMLADAYKVAGIHFHWGADDTQGSEHTVSGRRFPLEMHMVTYDSEKYDSVGAAVFETDALAVLGVFFEISERNNTVFSNFIENLKNVKETGESVEIAYVPLSDLLPAANHKYYRYLGSLTTPPCAESVIWTVFRETHHISSAQLEEFRGLMWEHDGHTSAMINNYRHPLALQSRHVYRSFLKTDERPRPIPDQRPKPMKGESTGGATVRTAGALTIGLLAIASRFL